MAGDGSSGAPSTVLSVISKVFALDTTASSGNDSNELELVRKAMVECVKLDAGVSTTVSAAVPDDGFREFRQYVLYDAPDSMWVEVEVGWLRYFSRPCIVMYCHVLSYIITYHMFCCKVPPVLV